MMWSIKKMGAMALVFGASLIGSGTSQAGIIYSGLQNINLESVDGAVNNVTIDLAGDLSNTWDNMQFDIFQSGNQTTAGSNTSWMNAPAVLGYFSQFPYVEQYGEGATPVLNFGSGSMLLWSFTTDGIDQGMFRNTIGYAALMLGDFDGPKYFGWMQIEVQDYQNLNGFGPMITIIDWAFDDTGAVLAMGEGRVAAVPAPAAFALMSAVLLGLGWSRRKSRLNR